MIKSILNPCLWAFAISFASVSFLDVIFKVLIAVFNSKSIQFIYDTLYFINFSLVSIIVFFYFNDGQGRWYYIVSEMLGIVVYYLTLSKLLKRIIDFILKVAKKIGKKH